VDSHIVWPGRAEHIVQQLVVASAAEHQLPLAGLFGHSVRDVVTLNSPQDFLFTAG